MRATSQYGSCLQHAADQLGGRHISHPPASPGGHPVPQRNQCSASLVSVHPIKQGNSSLKHHPARRVGIWMHPPHQLQLHRPPHMSSTSQIRAISAEQAAAVDPKLPHVLLDHIAHRLPPRRELPLGLDAHRLPRHVSVIMDGNARWAHMQGLQRPQGHAAGVKALMKLIYLSSDWGISAFSVFLFSTENWNRSQAEVSSLMDIYEKNLIEHLDNFSKYNMKVRVIGDTNQLPQSFQNTIFEVEKRTSQNSGMKIAFAINYGGRLDIIQAFQQVAKKLQQGQIELEDVSSEAIDNELWTSWMEDTQSPDLLIRTSGEQRISNFFLWQAAYSEIIFLDTCFPALNETLYSKALLDYQKRDRRYGKRQPLQLKN